MTNSFQTQAATARGLTRKALWSCIGPVLLLLSIGLYLLEAWVPAEQMDDAFISYRYAQNLAEGRGLVFNVGEHVEGYTNLSWTLLVAGGIRMGWSAPVVGHWLMLFSGGLLLWSSYRFAQRLLPRDSWFVGIAPLVVLSTNAFACWTASGLESALFAAMVVMAFSELLAGRRWSVALWCILAAMTRPEGMLLAFVLLGWDWLKSFAALERRTLGSALRLALPGLLFTTYFASHTAFRLYYYHDYVPNTFHAKVGGIPLSRGLEYLYNFAVDGPGLLVLPALLASWVLPRYRIAFFFVVLIAVYSASVGGDVFRLGRFLLPVLPLLVAGALAGSLWLFSRSRMGGLVLGMSLPLTMVISLYGTWPHTRDFVSLADKPFPQSAKRLDARNHMFFVSEEWVRQRAREIVGLQPPVRLIATVGIGKLGYYAMELPMLDLVGLTDSTVARSNRQVPATLKLPGHQRTDAPYVLSRRPDFIWIPRKGDSKTVTLPAVADLWNQPELERDYYWDDHFTAYRRKPN
ncbi:hypothetical protein [Pseudomonas sp.]|uniref:hypothetical protein n=1 Tax=Pseudomonas sp. TaxID=306 RepID=UPI002910CC84|nr:hypothetical protein [Pseudomonas sp.]MDU4250146.1 hypothetical protein [Pseudomonas sp.]